MKVIYPDTSSREAATGCMGIIPAPPHQVFPMWCSSEIENWFAAPGSSNLKPEIGRPYFFETHFDNQRHPHFGRILDLIPNRSLEMSWLTQDGTRGYETLLKVKFEPDGDPVGSETRIELQHLGFPDEESRSRHAEAWPMVLKHLASRVAE